MDFEVMGPPDDNGNIFTLKGTFDTPYVEI
jgi:hypothetical protein